MSCFNKVILIGPCYQIKSIVTKTGKDMIVFTLKTWHKAGEEERKAWHNIVAYSGAAKVLAANLKEGEHLFIEGRIDQYRDNEGNNRSQIIAEEFKFLGSKKEE